MHADGRSRLLEELADLYTVKLALLLVPVRQLLQAVQRQELAAAINTQLRDLSVELDAILANYEITPRGPLNSERRRMSRDAR